MTNSPTYTLLLELQWEFREEITQAVHQALAQHPANQHPAVCAAEPLALPSVREAAALLHVSVATIHQ